jgi:hypothetical protein
VAKTNSSIDKIEEAIYNALFYSEYWKTELINSNKDISQPND